MKLLFAAAEIYPYAKSGGLADVAQALPKELNKDIVVTSIMPLYSFIDREKHKIYTLNQSFDIELGEELYHVELYQGFNRGVKTLFVYEASLCDRSGLYGDEEGDYADNYMRFGLFSKALVVIAKAYNMEMLHLNDWHTALASLWVQELYPSLRTLFTIHNLAFQGIYPQEAVAQLGIDEKYFNSGGIEFWDSANLLKAGIAYSDKVTTVSPRYAQEILSASFGCGLEGFLEQHQEKLCGILNGIDRELFDPLSDQAIAQPYSLYSLPNKSQNKRNLCQELGLKEPERPLFVFVGRFTKQKGLDIIIKTLPQILEMDINISILGEGESNMADDLEKIAQEHSNLSLFFGYDESLSHRKYAAADFLLMPSSFEPCGLNQLISYRYGTLPLVHRVGGLYDTVIDIDAEESTTCGRGIVLESLDTKGLEDAIERAVALYREESSRLFEIIAKNMQCDVSFAKSADKYLDCYIDTID